MTLADSGADSLREVITNAAPGDVIDFDPSLAGGTITVLTNLPALNDANVTLDGDIDNDGIPDITITNGGTSNRALFVFADGVTVTGLNITGFTTSFGRGIFVGSAGSNSVISGNNITGNIDGVLIDFGDNVTVEDNVIASNSQFGVHIFNTSTGNLIQNNTINNNTVTGISVNALSPSTSVFSQNSIFDNGGQGIANPLGPNAPTISSVSVSGTDVTIDGDMTGTPSTFFTIEFFADDAGGDNEGRVFLGSATIETDFLGVSAFSEMISLTPDMLSQLSGGETVTATVTELVGGVTPIATSEFSLGGPTLPVIVANTDPVANAGGPYDVLVDGEVELDASGTTDAEDAIGDLTFEWDLDGDGNFGETGAAAERGDEVGVNPLFSAAGLNDGDSVIVDLLVTDSGGLTDTATATINVSGVLFGADPVTGDQTLTVGFGGGADDVDVRPDGGDVRLIVRDMDNGNAVLFDGTFSGAQRVVVYGGDGDDRIRVRWNLSGVNAEIYGGAGNDWLRGGDGDDIIDGGDGNDIIFGGAGRDLLAGGTGSDLVLGNWDDDIVIGGVLTGDRADFAAIMALWTSGDDYTTRVNNVSPILLPLVFDDGVGDILLGLQGQDWFVANSDDDLTDERHNEVLTEEQELYMLES